MSWAESLSHGLLLAFASAAHCAGMCGVFAVRAATVSPTGPSRVPGFALYGAGKTLTYVFLGALFGEAGRRVGTLGPEVRAGLALAFALLLLWNGWLLLRGQGRATKLGARLATLLAPLVRRLPRGSDALGRFSLGVATGALPCGVTSLALLDGAASGSVVSAILIMLALGLGTLPALYAVGWASRRLTGNVSRRLAFVGGLLLIGLALWTFQGALTTLLNPPADPATCCH